MRLIQLVVVLAAALSLFALSALRTTTVSTRVAAPLGLAGGAEPAADVEALLRSEPYIGDRMDRMQAQLRSVDAELQRTREPSTRRHCHGSRSCSSNATRRRRRRRRRRRHQSDSSWSQARTPPLRPEGRRLAIRSARRGTCNRELGRCDCRPSAPAPHAPSRSSRRASTSGGSSLPSQRVASTRSQRSQAAASACGSAISTALMPVRSASSSPRAARPWQRRCATSRLAWDGCRCSLARRSSQSPTHAPTRSLDLCRTLRRDPGGC